MATAAVKNRCAICGKERASFKCEGCAQTFCFNHVTDHRQQLNQQLDEIEVNRDLFRQTLTEQSTDPQKHSLIKQINQWEYESIDKIRRAADTARKEVLKNTTNYTTEIEGKLAKLTDQLREARQGNDFVETDLNHWKDELDRLVNELAAPTNISIRQGTNSLVTNISVNIHSKQYIPNIPDNAKWAQNGTTVAGGNGSGNGLNQLNYPIGLYIDEDQTIYVADYNNHRVVEWKNGATSGRVVAGGNGPGSQRNQLHNPTMVVIDKERDSLFICEYSGKRVMRWPCKNGTTGEIISSGITSFGLAMHIDGYLYVSDHTKHEVKRWKIGETNGTVVAGGNGSGNRPDQLNSPRNIFVDQDRSLYISDANNHRVMKWMEGAREGIVVAGGHGAGNGLKQLSSPCAVVVDQLGTVYVADSGNNQVMRWPKGATEGSIVVGGNGPGAQPNQFNCCLHLAFDREGNLFVVDYSNHRVQKFNIGPNSI